MVYLGFEGNCVWYFTKEEMQEFLQFAILWKEREIVMKSNK